MVGIDHNLVPILMANDLLRRHAHGVNKGKGYFVNAKAEKLSFKQDSFDMVICADFVEHISQNLYFSLLEEVYYVLKKNGIFIIYTPSAQHILERAKRLLRNLLCKQNSCLGVNYTKFLVDTLKCYHFHVLECFLEPNHLVFLQPIERFFIRFQRLWPYFGRRICIRAVAKKPYKKA